MTWATIQEVDEWIDDFAADDPLGALRDLAKHLTSHRLTPAPSPSPPRPSCTPGT